MNSKLKIISAFLFFVIFLSSCVDVQEADLEESVLDLSVTNNYYNLTELNLMNNELIISAMLIPSLNKQTIEIQVSSKADPQGFKINANLVADTYVSGSYEYRFLQMEERLQIGTATDANNKILKVSKGSDIITVKIADAGLEGTYKVSTADVLDMTYWSGNTTGTLWIYKYEHPGSILPYVKIWTDTDPINKLTLNTEGDASNSSFYRYFCELNFNTTATSSSGNALAVDSKQETYIYIEYEGKTYKSKFANEQTTPLELNTSNKSN